MEILNKDKLKAILEKWIGHPSINGLMEKFGKLQSYTNKSYKNLETYTKQKIKESKYELVELPYIDVKEDPVRPELDLTFRQTYGRKIMQNHEHLKLETLTIKSSLRTHFEAQTFQHKSVFGGQLCSKRLEGALWVGSPRTALVKASIVF